jgi:hypothetical protein
MTAVREMNTGGRATTSWLQFPPPDRDNSLASAKQKSLVPCITFRPIAVAA